MTSVSKIQKLSPIEHVLKRPDTYVGDMTIIDGAEFHFDRDVGAIVMDNIRYNPAAVKIFDEILNNAIDHSVRDDTMTYIKVSFDVDDGSITVINDGQPIDVSIHAEHKVHGPELIFGHMLTSTNYDDDEKRIVGGRNGLGAKLTNIFSSKFVIHIVNGVSKKTYTQVFKNNMAEIGKPKIVSNRTTRSSTQITFWPDWQRFDFEDKDSFFKSDTFSYIQKRVWDASAMTRKTIKVFMDDVQIQTKTFKDYFKLLVGCTDPIFHQQERWEVVLSPTSYAKGSVCISYVNGIHTYRNGTHVDHVVKQVLSALKSKIQAKSSQVMSFFDIGIKCLIENPTFSSQGKEHHTTKLSSFGSRFEMSDAFTRKLLKSGIVEFVTSTQMDMDEKKLQKTDGIKKRFIKGIPKLEDAEKAGTVESNKCTLILTEGDSAKAFAMAGLGIIGRKYYGIFPLRGKVLNVRDASIKKIGDNVEINNLKTIIGLRQTFTYETKQEQTTLRYGRVMVMTDADVDGSHIKGLIFNVFSTFWPFLFKQTGFLQAFITPMIKAKRGNQVLSFFTNEDYEAWVKETFSSGRVPSGWDIKYYKGLGTSNTVEAKEYFKRFDNHQMYYDHSGTASDDNAMILAFNKQGADNRKVWLVNAMRNGVLPMDYSPQKRISFDEFINRDFIQFSLSDLKRSIPCLCDGMKPSQRKILQVVLNHGTSGITKDIKVVQLASMVANQMSYHHGETSLMSTIIGMAQDFCGSNNFPLLVPNGQFGSRLENGKDAAQARYIYTYLQEYAKTLFDPRDDVLLEHHEDEGVRVEPLWFIPVLPVTLLNGCEGIGTGFSTTIPSFNPEQIVTNLGILLDNPDADRDDLIPMDPWYKGFKGTIEQLQDDEQTWKSKGIWKRISPSKVVISELPVCPKMDSISSYKEYLDKLSDDWLTEYVSNCTDSDVHFTLVADPPTWDLMISQDRLEKELKLEKNIRTTNMYLFDENDVLVKFDDARDILLRYWKVRIQCYEKRKIHLLSYYDDQINKWSDMMRFIQAVLNDEIVVFRRSKKDVGEQLIQHGFQEPHGPYLAVSLSHFTTEEIDKLDEKCKSLVKTRDILMGKTQFDLYSEDIEAMMEYM